MSTAPPRPITPPGVQCPDSAVLETMRRRESRHYLTSDYLSLHGGSITEEWREKIGMWSYQVVDHFDLQRSTVAIAMNYVDRCCRRAAIEAPSGGLLACHRTYQLMAMTCLYVAIKVHEFKRYLRIDEADATSMHAMLRLSRGGYAVAQMREMELYVLRSLEWYLHPPTALHFVYEIVGRRLGSASSDVRRECQSTLDVAAYLVELSVLDYYFVNHRPSDVAKAALRLDVERDPNVAACRRRLIRLYELQRSADERPLESPVSVIDERRIANKERIDDDRHS